MKTMLLLVLTSSMVLLAACTGIRVDPPEADQGILVFNSDPQAACTCDDVTLAEGQKCIICSEPSPGNCVCTIQLVVTPSSGGTDD